METKRKDHLKNIIKVAQSRLKDPLKTTREVEAETGLDHSTVALIDKELRQSSTEVIDEVLRNDDEILKLFSGFTLQQLQRYAADYVQEGKIEANVFKTLADISEKSTKRKAIFGKKDEEGSETPSNITINIV